MTGRFVCREITLLIWHLFGQHFRHQCFWLIAKSKVRNSSSFKLARLHSIEKWHHFTSESMANLIISMDRDATTKWERLTIQIVTRTSINFTMWRWWWAFRIAILNFTFRVRTSSANWMRLTATGPLVSASILSFRLYLLLLLLRTHLK